MCFCVSWSINNARGPRCPLRSRHVYSQSTAAYTVQFIPVATTATPFSLIHSLSAHAHAPLTLAHPLTPYAHLTHCPFHERATPLLRHPILDSLCYYRHA